MIAMCVQAVEMEIDMGRRSEVEGQERLVVLRRMLMDARGDTSFATVVHGDAGIVASLERSVALSAAHMASEEAILGHGGVCPHTHLEEWHGAPEPFHCKRCKAAVTDAGRVEHERQRAAEVRGGEGKGGRGRVQCV